MKAFTDYPFTSLGDAPYEQAPIREIQLVFYDGDNTCQIIVEGIYEEIKTGYIYTTPTSAFKNAKFFTKEQLNSLAN